MSIQAPDFGHPPAKRGDPHVAAIITPVGTALCAPPRIGPARPIVLGPEYVGLDWCAREGLWQRDARLYQYWPDQPNLLKEMGPGNNRVWAAIGLCVGQALCVGAPIMQVIMGRSGEHPVLPSTQEQFLRTTAWALEGACGRPGVRAVYRAFQGSSGSGVYQITAALPMFVVTPPFSCGDSDDRFEAILPPKLWDELSRQIDEHRGTCQ